MWICEACEKLASCLWVDWVAMIPGASGPSSLQPHGEAAGEQRMEFHEAGPGLVEQDVVAKRPDAPEDHAGVVDRAVISALLDDRDAERSRPRQASLSATSGLARIFSRIAASSSAS